MNKLSLPEQFEQFSEARRNGFINVKEMKENGGLVAGVFCTFTPLEILDAAGILAVSLCGMSEETIPDAEGDLPKNLCPLIKSSYGFAVSEKCPYFYFADIIIGETTCDGKKKMYEILGEIKDTHVMQLPQGINFDYAHEAWNKENHRLIKILQEKFEVEINNEKLRAAAEMRNKLRTAACQLMELSKLTPPPLKGYELYKVLDGIGFNFDLNILYEKINDIINTTMKNYNEGLRPVSKNAKRILITGCPIGGVFDKVVNTIEENDGVVVCFENCAGIKPARYMVDTTAEDIISAISERYLNIGCSVMTPNQNRMELLSQLIEEFKVDGVVEIVLQACHTYNIETKSIKKLVNSKGVPYISIETDYSKSDLGQVKTRLTAFLEML